jgi:hypothetical protein
MILHVKDEIARPKHSPSRPCGRFDCCPQNRPRRDGKMGWGVRRHVEPGTGAPSDGAAGGQVVIVRAPNDMKASPCQSLPPGAGSSNQDSVLSG